MRRLRVLSGAGAVLALLVPAPSLAAHRLHRFVQDEQAPQLLVRDAMAAGALGPRLTRPLALRTTSALDCVHAAHDVRLDPVTGATTAELALEIRANGSSLAAVAFTLDEGLSIDAVSAEARALSVTEGVFTPARVVQIALSPPLAPGESTTIHVKYSGTLACSASPESGAVGCTKGADFSSFSHRSVFPFLFDPAAPDDAVLDGMTREVVLRVPANVDAVATGERVAESIEGDQRVSRWTIAHPLSRALGMYIFAGKLGRAEVPGRSVPTTLVYPAPKEAVDERLLAWSAPVLDFVEKFGGARLPFERSMTLVRLPSEVPEPGTATYGMTLLSESYARAGDLMHEETWAHENAHLFWGIVVPERSSSESRLMSEGLATLAGIDYTYAHHFAGEERDRYLARRFVPIGIDLRTQAPDIPPVWLASHQSPPDAASPALYTTWAYAKTAATLDHLRATLGDEAFDRALATYVTECRYVGCGPGEFKEILERTSGEDLGPFFQRWMTSTTRPRVTLSFEPEQTGADVTLAKSDALPLSLQLFITLEDGQVVRRRVDLKDEATTLHVDAPQGVRSVTTSPRHEVMIDARSAVEGDLDFDGETDGFDLLRCSRLVGTSYRSQNGLGLWSISESFDPRCDVDGDLQIDDEDLMGIAYRFGKLRPL
jgi:Peptidase family M1 domain